MPYIKQSDREKFDNILKDFKVISKDLTAGDLNYLISRMLWGLFDSNRSYTKANELMGVLECVKQEFYRRKAVPYEEEKIEENGDI